MSTMFNQLPNVSQIHQAFKVRPLQPYIMLIILHIWQIWCAPIRCILFIEWRLAQPCFLWRDQAPILFRHEEQNVRGVGKISHIQKNIILGGFKNHYVRECVTKHERSHRTLTEKEWREIYKKTRIIFIFTNSDHENKFSLVFWKSMKKFVKWNRILWKSTTNGIGRQFWHQYWWKIREMKSDTIKIHDQ